MGPFSGALHQISGNEGRISFRGIKILRYKGRLVLFCNIFKMTSRLKKITRIAFITAYCTVVFCCLLSCLSPFLQPGSYALIALLGLVFPFLFFIVLAMGVYWLVRRSKWAWLSAITLLLGLPQFFTVFGCHLFGTFSESKPPQTLRVLTWNLSSWGTTRRNNPNMISYRREMTEILKSSNADVLCLQEYHFLKARTFRDSLIPELKENGYNYAYFVRSRYTMKLYNSAHVTGVAIVSKYPITDTTHFEYGNNDFAEPLIYADIQFNNQTIRLFTTHLQSVRFESYDLETLHSLKEPGTASVTKSRALAWKLKQAYKKREAQAALVHQKITESPYPVIVCGDFNDVPGSYTYVTVKDKLQDAFLKKGFGFGRTYRFISPTLRIDYILADKKFTISQYKKIEVPYSDHYPVIADITVEEK